MKNTIFQGSLILMASGFLGKFLGAIYRIPLSNILSPEGMGIYQMVFSVFSLALVVCSGGVSASVAYYIAKIRGGTSGNTKIVFVYGMLYSLITSLLFSTIFIFLGDKIAQLQGISEAGFAYRLCSLALIFASLLASFRGLYQGYQNMSPTAVSQLLEQIFKVVFALSLSYVLSKTSVHYGVFGAFLGLSISEILTFLYFVIKVKKFKFEGGGDLGGNFFKTNASITLSALIIPLCLAIDSFVVVNILCTFLSQSQATALFGLQSGIVSSLINFPVVVSVSISLVLLPMLSYNIALKNTEKAKHFLENMFLLCLSVLLPCVLVFLFFAKDILAFLYPSISSDLLQIAKLLLQFSSIQIIFISVLQIMTSVFQSLGKAHFVSVILLIAGVLKTFSTIFLVAQPSINIFGVVIGNLLFYGMSSLYLLIAVQKYVECSLPRRAFLFGLGSVLALGSSFVLINVYLKSLLVKILGIVICFTIFYLVPLYISNFFGVRKFVKHIFVRNQNE